MLKFGFFNRVIVVGKQLQVILSFFFDGLEVAVDGTVSAEHP
jgi:hypothetical protein